MSFGAFCRRHTTHLARWARWPSQHVVQPTPVTPHPSPRCKIMNCTNYIRIDQLNIYENVLAGRQLLDRILAAGAGHHHWAGSLMLFSPPLKTPSSPPALIRNLLSSRHFAENTVLGGPPRHRHSPPAGQDGLLEDHRVRLLQRPRQDPVDRRPSPSPLPLPPTPTPIPPPRGTTLRPPPKGHGSLQRIPQIPQISEETPETPGPQSPKSQQGLRPLATHHREVPTTVAFAGCIFSNEISEIFLLKKTRVSLLHFA